jgi:FkbM family methyltransferase
MAYLLQKYGLKIDVPKNAPDFIPYLVHEGKWEDEECQIILKSIKGHRVLEGGAGLGVTSALLGKRAEFVISFEANPEMAKAAQKNQKQNNSLTKIVNAALGAKEGEAYFDFSDELWDSKIAKSKGKNRKKVKIVDAQRIIDEYKINALVLDVEGEEEAIMDKINLSPIKVLIIELHENVNKTKIIKKVQDAGFKIKSRHDKVNHSILWADKETSFNLLLLIKNITKLGRVDT